LAIVDPVVLCAWLTATALLLGAVAVGIDVTQGTPPRVACVTFVANDA
jgi:hypothetical protein